MRFLPMVLDTAKALARAGRATAYGTAPLLPPPLWGRVGVGGRAVGRRGAASLDPHPRPLPTRGRGDERPSTPICDSAAEAKLSGDIDRRGTPGIVHLVGAGPGDPD